MIQLPNLEQSWKYAKNILSAATYCNNVNGLYKLREQWKQNKSKLLQMFGEDGRIQVDMPTELSKNMYNVLLAETGNLFYEMGLKVPHVISYINAEEFQTNTIIHLTHEDKEGCKGMKVSKFLTRKYVPKELADQFNVKFSMIIQKTKQTGTLIVSINPLDLLLISHNGITSCHRLGDNEEKNGSGEYAAGTLEYLVDKYTAVSFLTNNHMKYIYINGKDCGFKYPWKLWRQLCYIDLDNLSALFMRQYMNEHGDAHKLARKIVAHAMRDYIGDSELGWFIKYSDDLDLNVMIKNETGLPYIDSVSSMIRLRHPNADYPNICLNVYPYCPVCGHHRITNSEFIICDYCRGYSRCCECKEQYHRDDMQEHNGCMYCNECFNQLFGTCYECGEVSDKDDMYFYDGVWYCPDCIDEVTRCCDICGDRHDPDDMYYLENGNYLCRYCYYDHAGECDECGTYHRDYDLDTIDDITLCPKCVDKYIETCVECGDRHFKSNMDEFDGDYYCSDCYDEVTEICAKCSKVFLENEMYEHEGDYYCTDCYNDLELEESDLLDLAPAAFENKDRLQEVV